MKKEWNLSPEQLKREREIMEKLKQFDTPTITNVVASYPNDKNCLRLYNPWYGRCIQMQP